MQGSCRPGRLSSSCLRCLGGASAVSVVGALGPRLGRLALCRLNRSLRHVVASPSDKFGTPTTRSSVSLAHSSSRRVVWGQLLRSPQRAPAVCAPTTLLLPAEAYASFMTSPGVGQVLHRRIRHCAREVQEEKRCDTCAASPPKGRACSERTARASWLTRSNIALVASVRGAESPAEACA